MKETCCDGEMKASCHLWLQSTLSVSTAKPEWNQASSLTSEFFQHGVYPAWSQASFLTSAWFSAWACFIPIAESQDYLTSLWPRLLIYCSCMHIRMPVYVRYLNFCNGQVPCKQFVCALDTTYLLPNSNKFKYYTVHKFNKMQFCLQWANCMNVHVCSQQLSSYHYT